MSELIQVMQKRFKDYEVSKIQTFISKFEEKKEENKTKQKRTRRRNKKLRLQLTH